MCQADMLHLNRVSGEKLKEVVLTKIKRVNQWLSFEFGIKYLCYRSHCKFVLVVYILPLVVLVLRQLIIFKGATIATRAASKWGGVMIKLSGLSLSVIPSVQF